MYAVILAGGGGTRLWPLSRRARPKPFLPLLGDESLFQATLRRLPPVIAPDDVYIVAEEAHMPLVREQAPWLRVDQLVGETFTSVDQVPTTVQYYEGVPDKAVQLLKFDLTELQGKPGLGIQAILSIGQDAGTKVEDWTGLSERKFCVKSDDLRKIVLVVSNSSVASGQTVEGGIKVEALGSGCSGWTGGYSGEKPADKVGLTTRPAVSYSVTGMVLRLADVVGNVEDYEAVRGDVMFHSELGNCQEDGTGSIPGDLFETEVPQLEIDRSVPDHPTYRLYIQVRVTTTAHCVGDPPYASEGEAGFISDGALPMTMENGEWIIQGTYSEAAACACGMTEGEGLTVKWRFTSDH
jgi:hypothetical protein